MKPPTLTEMAAQQKAAGIVAPPVREDGPELDVPGHPDNPWNPPRSGPEIFIREQGLPGGGYIKIFPPKFNSVAELTPEWIEANWSAPSPWCAIEGLPDHPEFEANLAGVEK